VVKSGGENVAGKKEERGSVRIARFCARREREKIGEVTLDPTDVSSSIRSKLSGGNPLRGRGKKKKKKRTVEPGHFSFAVRRGRKGKKPGPLWLLPSGQVASSQGGKKEREKKGKTKSAHSLSLPKKHLLAVLILMTGYR